MKTVTIKELMSTLKRIEKEEYPEEYRAGERYIIADNGGMIHSGTCFKTKKEAREFFSEYKKQKFWG